MEREALNIGQKTAIAGVMLYRVTLGRLLGGQCRFQPTCSQYAIDAVKLHGAWRGSLLAIRRIGRCHPWGGRGYDPVRPPD